MAKIVSISGWGNESISGYVDTGRSYRGFTLSPGGVEYGKPMPKKRWGLTSPEQFAGVIGKFDPDAFVLKRPLVVKRLNFKELDGVLSGDPRFVKQPSEEE